MSSFNCHDCSLSSDLIFHMKLSKKVVGQGAPLVLFHGGMGSINHWQRNIDALAEYFTVYAVELPGYGESPSIPKDTPREEYVRVVCESLDEILPHERFSLAGFSFGGIMAALCAARLGSRIVKLSLMGPGGFVPMGPKLDLRKIPDASEGLPAVRAVLKHNLQVMMIADPLKVTEEAIDLHYDNVLRTRFDGRPFSLSPGLMAQCLQQMKCPVQIVWGGADTLCYPNVEPRAAEARAASPSIRIDVVAKAGHWVQFEAPLEVNALMLDFLRPR